MLMMFLEDCVFDSGENCNPSFIGVLLFFLGCLIYGIFLIVKNRGALKAVFSEKRRKMTAEELRQERIVEARNKIYGANLGITISILGIIGFLILLIYLGISLAPILVEENNLNAYLSAGLLAFVTIIEGLCWWGLIKSLSNKRKAKKNLEEEL